MFFVYAEGELLPGQPEKGWDRMVDAMRFGRKSGYNDWEIRDA